MKHYPINTKERYPTHFCIEANTCYTGLAIAANSKTHFIAISLYDVV